MDIRGVGQLIPKVTKPHSGIIPNVAWLTLPLVRCGHDARSI